MSLVQHLYRPGPVQTWWASRLPGLRRYAAELGQFEPRSRTLSVAGVEHAAQVGGIVGRRLETFVEAAPPYAAILMGGMRADAALWPTHADLAGEQRAAAVEYRPTPQGWRHLVPATDTGRHSATIRQVAEIETSSSDELDLARAAGAVNALESAYRSGAAVTMSTPAAVEDSAGLVSGLRRSIDTAARLCAGGTVRGHAAPVFAPHWADGDLLLGPGHAGGYGLIDVKTVGASTLRDQTKVAGWLTQLLSYVACDAAEDLWRVRAIGVWLPRQDALMVWPLREIWSRLDVDERQVLQLADVLTAAYQRDHGAA